MREIIWGWTIRIRRPNRPAVEGYREDKSMIHVYISAYDVPSGIVTCAETGLEYQLTGAPNACEHI